MAVATSAYFVQSDSGYGRGPAHQASALDPLGVAQPVWLYGNGTPNNIEPFNGAGVGSHYTEVNATSVNPNLWLKTANNDAVADWVLQGSAGIVAVRSQALYDISAADSEQVCYVSPTASEVISASLLWEEATDSAGADSGDITIGVSTGNGDIVAATAYGLSQAAASIQNLTIADGELVAGEAVFASHDTVAEAGTYWLQLLIRVEA